MQAFLRHMISMAIYYILLHGKSTISLNIIQQQKHGMSLTDKFECNYRGAHTGVSLKHIFPGGSVVVGRVILFWALFSCGTVWQPCVSVFLDHQFTFLDSLDQVAMFFLSSF